MSSWQITEDTADNMRREIVEVDRTDSCEEGNDYNARSFWSPVSLAVMSGFADSNLISATLTPLRTYATSSFLDFKPHQSR